MKQVKLPVDLVNTVLNYLATRPFNEVHTLIKEIQEKCVLIEEEIKND